MLNTIGLRGARGRCEQGATSIASSGEKSILLQFEPLNPKEEYWDTYLQGVYARGERTLLWCINPLTLLRFCFQSLIKAHQNILITFCLSPCSPLFPDLQCPCLLCQESPVIPFSLLLYFFLSFQYLCCDQMHPSKIKFDQITLSFKTKALCYIHSTFCI